VRTYRGTFSGGQQAIVFNGEVTWSLVDGELGPAGERIYKVTAANANIPSTFPGCSAPGAVQIDVATSVLGVDASNPGASALRRTLSVRAHDDYLRQRLSAVWVHVVHLPNRKQRDRHTKRFERGTTSWHLQRQ
jgi:hypothetical protein